LAKGNEKTHKGGWKQLSRGWDSEPKMAHQGTPFERKWQGYNLELTAGIRTQKGKTNAELGEG